MIRNYFKVALRNLMRNKLFALINILGLAIGIVSCILIYIYVKDELSFDAHHKNEKDLYRIQAFYMFDDVEDKFAITPFPFVPALLNEYPEIADGTRIYLLGNQNVIREDKMYSLQQAYFADTNFFKLFDYEFIQGNAKTALSQPENIVLTDADAIRIFGKTDVINQTLVRNNITLKVSGVVSTKKYNTHIEPGAFLPMSGMNPQARDQLATTWGQNNCLSYIMVKTEAAKKNLETKLKDFVDRFVLPQWKQFGFSGKIEVHAEPIRDIHFNNYLIYDTPVKGNKSYVYIFIVVACLILFISCINFVNMSTAAATKRSKEVAVRKVMGAQKKQLIFQFISESLLIAIVSLLVSLALLELMIPLFNQITGKEIDWRYVLDPSFILFIIGIIFLIGIVAGSYPAFFLSGSIPNLLLKDSISRKQGVRKSLMVLQFVIAFFMITGTIAVYSQINYLKNKELGFKSKNIVAITIPPNQGDTLVSQKLRNLKNELKKERFVQNATFTYNIPGQNPSRFVFKVKSKNGNQDKPIAVASSDADFPKIMGMRLVSGRYLSDSIATDENFGIMVNQATAKLLNWKDPLSEALYLPTGDSANPEVKLNIVGVLSDFHFSSLHSAIEPMVVFKNNPAYVAGFMIVEIADGNTDNVMNNLQMKWKEIFPNKDFEYKFLDDSLAEQYLAEDKLMQVFSYFAAVAIALTIMGLYGLSFFQTQQRTKEIGIRKVMGASAFRIISLVNKDFFILLLIGMVISVPVSWYCIHLWLNNFAYHTSFSVMMVVLSFICIALVTIGTVSLQVTRTALQNPVKSLRYE